MARAVFAGPTALVAGTATLTQSGGTMDSLYPLTNLVDGNPAKPAKWTTTTAAHALFDWSSAQRVDGVYLPIYNCAAASTITVAMNATNSWGSPSLSVSKAVPAYGEDGLPVGMWFDLRAETGYLVGGYRYLRVSFPSGAVNLAVGEIVIVSALTEMTYGPNFGNSLDEIRRQVQAETAYGVRHVYDLGVRQERFAATVDTTSAGQVQLRSLHRAARGAKSPWLFVLDPAVAHGAVMVRFSGPTAEALARTDLVVDRHVIQVELIEQQRGRAL